MHSINLFRKKKPTYEKKPADAYLEVKVCEGASERDVAAIVQALATISSFFGVRLDQGGGGSGGKPLDRIQQKDVILRPPHSGPESRIGGLQ